MELYWYIIYMLNMMIFVFNIIYIIMYRSSHKEYMRYIKYYKEKNINQSLKKDL